MIGTAVLGAIGNHIWDCQRDVKSSRQKGTKADCKEASSTTTDRRVFMAHKQYNVGDDILDLKLGDVLIWHNPDAIHDCDVTGCYPALDSNHYHVPVGLDVPAIRTRSLTRSIIMIAAC